MIEFTKKSRQSHERHMEKKYGIGTDVLYAEGIESRTGMAVEALEERGLDPEDLFLDDGFVQDLYHDTPGRPGGRPAGR